MSVNRNLHSDNLYLCKEENQEIYVAISQLLQHQIDGIRFLHRQFKKKRKGVILNDPSGYGKTLQIALFLSAIHHTLKKPVLIMCNEDDLENWIEHFQKWTELSSDIVIKSPRPPSKNIYITLITDFLAFTRRDWSILVLDDDTFNKKTLQNLSNITADHKICVTSLDMKNNLPIFATIYQWLYPKEKLVIDEFIANTSNVKDVVEKSILLDSFFEDIVIRRMGYKDSPFKQKLQRDETSYKVTKEIQKISRKNKDATGTKIKRTKRKTEDNEDTELKFTNGNTNKVAKNNYDHSVILPTDNKDKSSLEITNINDVNTNEFENSIHNEEPVLSECLKEFNCLDFTRDTEKNNDSQDKNPEIDILENKAESSSGITDLGNHLCKDEKGNLTIVANSPSQSSNFNDRNQINSEVKDKSSPCNQKDRSEVKNDKTSKIKSFDDKILLIEENALKKFKGSLLDSIF